MTARRLLQRLVSMVMVGSIVVTAVVWIVFSAKAQVPENKAMVNQLRERLRKIADSADSDLVQQYWELLAESGLKPAFWHGGQLPLAHGYTLLRSADADTWAIRSTSGQDQKLGDGVFLITERGSEPIKADKNSVLLAINGERVLIVQLDARSVISTSKPPR